MKKHGSKIISALGAVVLAVLLGSSSLLAGEMGPDLRQIWPTLGPDDELPVIVSFVDKVDLELFKGRPGGRPARALLIKTLKTTARASQETALGRLTGHGIKNLVSLWATNQLALTARPETILQLARLPEVENVRLDLVINAPVTTESFPTFPEWNLQMIGAPELWALGYAGGGVVVAGMDTGVDVRHPDLASKWRGGANSWYDPNGEHDTPDDRSGHGTQTMGLMVGGQAGGTSIGAAPDATWIAVKIFNDSGQATLSNIHLGFQWLLDPDGDPDTDDAPAVVNNSWGFNVSDYCYLEFQPDIEVLRTAGVAVVFSAGNQGPWSYSSLSPANNPDGYAVGAVDDTSGIAAFSSRGPSACDETIYPEVTAPGVSVKTSDLTFGGIFLDSYTYVSGTSFAAPHVAGAMAVLLSAFPDATVEEIEEALKNGARDWGVTGPDNDYGYGVIDLPAAFAILGEQPGPVCVDADGDGYFGLAGCGTAQDCDDGNNAVYPGASEVKHDGLDQDCNGYDLTIDIITADYDPRRDTLVVEAASGLGPAADLNLVGFGPMRWNQRKSFWAVRVHRAGGDPGTVVVSGIEGSESASTGSSQVSFK